MRPKQRRADLLRSRLDAIIDVNQALVKLSRTIDSSSGGMVRWGLRAQAGPLTMAGLAIFKHTYDLSDG